MSQFDDISIQHGIVIRSAWIANDVSLTINSGGRILITYCYGLSHAYARLGIETMIEVLNLVRGGYWEGSRFWFRFPLPADPEALRASTARARRDYRIPERRARRRLIPDTLLAQAEREDWDWWQLIEATDLNDDICAARVKEWRARTPTITLFAAGALDGPIPF